jgi:hypothetical protein
MFCILKESFLVVLHDLHLKKSMPPQKKYNAAQRIAYSVVILMGLGSILTGLSIYKPIQFHTLTSLLGGYELARIEHFTLTILFTLFFLVHVIQVILAGWNNFQSMVTGLFVLKEVQPVVVPLAITRESQNVEIVDLPEEENSPQIEPLEEIEKPTENHFKKDEDE